MMHKLHKNNKLKLLALLMIMTISLVFFTACENDEPAVSPGNGDNPQDTTSPSPDPNDPTVSDGTPFERYGILQILNGQLCDERGNPVQLKGMSSFGLQWSDGYWVLTDEAFDVLTNDWECDIIRLAMCVTEGGYRDNPSLILERVERGIELATARGLYVMIDWHVLTPGNPNDELYLTAGLDDPNMPAEFLSIKDTNPSWTGPQVFFAYLAQKYAHQGNVLYETANEPNRIGNFGARFDVWTNELKPYHESIIEVIREHDKVGIIICGTDNWSQFVDAPIEDPLDDPNVMYAMHFYAGTHDDWLRDITDNALNNGLAIFVTEWGASTASGDGGPYIYSAIEWNTFMNDRNLSWAAWSMAQKYEISAAFNHTTSPYPDGVWEDSEVSIAGRFYRAMIKGDPVPMYTEDLEVAKTPGEAVHNGDVSHLPPDDPGDFISLPFTFESGTREGWGKEGGSKIELSALFIGVAETQALGFHFTFTPDESRWEDGARLGSPHFPNSGLNLAQSEDIKAFTMEVFVEDGAASKGMLRLATVIVPDGSPYWFEAGSDDRFIIDPVNGGELITNPNGLILRKFTINIPFSISDYPTEMRPRNFVLALYNDEDDGSDFSGLIFYDNIGFVFD
jgi:endoglucanase